MPAYDGSGFQKQLLLSPGVPGYSIGSFNDQRAFTKIYITSVAVDGSDVATVIGQIVEGNIPVIGQTISIRGTQSNAGIFNVTDVALAGVSMSGSVPGLATLTFSLTTSTISTTTDYGVGLIKTAEIPENIAHAVGGFAGQAFALQSYSGLPSQGRTMTWMYNWTTAPTASCTVNLEGAETIADFTAGVQKVIDAGSSLTGETRIIQVPTTINFIRVNISALSSSADVLGIAKVIV